MEGLIGMAIIGVIAGWLAGKLTKGSGFGLFRDLVIGIIGAFVGGFLLRVLDIPAPQRFLGELATATVGAVVFLYVAKLINK